MLFSHTPSVTEMTFSFSSDFLLTSLYPRSDSTPDSGKGIEFESLWLKGIDILF